VALAAIYAENTTLEEGRLTKAVFSTYAMVIAAFVPRRPAHCGGAAPDPDFPLRLGRGDGQPRVHPTLWP
jgi:hypothetical protein